MLCKMFDSYSCSYSFAEEFYIRMSECEELGLEANTKAVLEDVGHNADLYIANQEDSTQN